MSQSLQGLVCRALEATRPSVLDRERYQQWRTTAQAIAHEFELYMRDFDAVRFNRACGLVRAPGTH